MTEWIYRVDMTVYNSGSTSVLRYATRPYATPATHPTIPNLLIPDGVLQPLLFRREMFGSDRTRGDMEIGHGEIVLDNSDGALDFLRAGYAFDGRKVELYRIDPDNLATSDTVMWRGVAEDFTLDFATLTLAVRDFTYLFDRPLQQTKFAGTNSLPSGLEGTTSDIGGHPKPKWFGTVYNVEPPCVNTTRLIYQVHDVALTTGFSLTVYDKRSALSAGISRPIADFQNPSSSATVSSIDTTLDQITLGVNPFTTGDPVHVASTVTLPGGVLDTQYYYAHVVSTLVISLHPTASDASANTNKVDITSAGSGTITVARNRTPYGRYDWCSDSSGSYIRTGLQPARITFDGTNGTAGTNDTFDQVFSAVYNAALAQNSDITALGLTTIDDRIGTSYVSMRVGYFFGEDITIYQALREMARTQNASLQSYVDNGTGASRLVLQHLEAGGAPNDGVLALDDTEYLRNSLRRIKPQDEERGIPPWRVTVNYQRNYTVMNASELAGSALSAIAFAQAEYRAVQADNATVKSVYPSSPEVFIDTGIVLSTDATTLGGYWRSVLQPGSNAAPGGQMFSAQMPLDDFMAFISYSSLYSFQYTGVMLGSTRVNVTSSRFSLSGGKNFGPIASVVDFQARTAELTLWG